MSAKYPTCRTCYFNNRSPEICEECVEGSEYEPPVGSDDEVVSGSGSKVVKIHKKKVPS